MPSYYGTTIARNAQRRAMKRLEAEKKARGNARSAAGGGCSEDVSRKRHDLHDQTGSENRNAATVGNEREERGDEDEA